MRSFFVLCRICIRKIIMKNVFDCGFFELKTANFIQVIFSDILLFFVIVENSHLNIVWTDWPNVKILNVAELVHEYGRFANFYFAVFIWWIDHFSSALYNWFFFWWECYTFQTSTLSNTLGLHFGLSFLLQLSMIPSHRWWFHIPVQTLRLYQRWNRLNCELVRFNEKIL